jgi:hypothetical protein
VPFAFKSACAFLDFSSNLSLMFVKYTYLLNKESEFTYTMAGVSACVFVLVLGAVLLHDAAKMLKPKANIDT